MKYIAAILLLLIGGTSFGNNPSYAVDLIPDSLLENADAVIRFQQREYHINSRKEAAEKIKAVITILNEQNSYDHLVVYYNQFRKIGKIKAKLYDKDGKEIREIKKSEIIDHQAYDGFSIYSDARVKYVDLSYGIFPYTIEYEYSLTHDGLMGFTTWTPQAYNTSIEQSSFRVSLPEVMSFNYKEEHIGEATTSYTKEGRQFHQWILQQRSVLLKEAYCPDDYQILPELIAVHEEFSVSGYKGSLKNWNTYGQFIYELNKGRGQLSAGMAAKVKEMTAKATKPAEKAAILYDYLQEQMRYVSVQLGIGGWQTFDAQYVEKNKYGDCKALTYFMKAMLAEINIPAYPALVYAGNQKKEVEEDFTIPNFNHVILKIPLEQPIWLECTSNHNPFGYLGSFTSDRQVLVVTPQGGQLEQTPPVAQNERLGETTIILNEKGGAMIQSTTQFNGIPHERFRSKAVYTSKEEQEKWFLEEQHFPAFTIEKLSFDASDSTAISTCAYEITVSRYGTKAGKRLFVPLNKVNPFSINLSRDHTRLHPLELSKNINEEDQITFQLPTDYAIESLPKPVEIETDFGTYHAKAIASTDKRITYTRRLTIPKQTIAADQYQKLRLFFKNINKMDNTKVVLVKE